MAPRFFSQKERIVRKFDTTCAAKTQKKASFAHNQALITKAEKCRNSGASTQSGLSTERPIGRSLAWWAFWTINDSIPVRYN